LCCCCNCSCQRMISSINSGNPLDSANIFRFFLCSVHHQSSYKRCLTSLFQLLLPAALTLIFFSFFSSLAIIDISHFTLQTLDRQHTAARQLQQQGTAVTSLHVGLRVKYVQCTTPAVTLLLLLQWETCKVCTVYNPCCDAAAAAAVRDVHLLQRWWGQRAERAVAHDRSYYAKVNVNRRSLVVLDRWSLTAGIVQWENNPSLQKWS